MITPATLAALRRTRVSPDDPFAVDDSVVHQRLTELSESSGSGLEFDEAGRSAEGRSIYLAALGGGRRRILLWSQMHGDEPTHTCVLLDLLAFLCREHADPLAVRILEGCTLYAVPLLNPDGAARGTRVNAQHIDVNRDARDPQTPEGRLLRRLVLELEPAFAFNLHNQNARSTVGATRRQAAVSLLAPPSDAAHTVTSQIVRAKQVAVGFLSAVERLCPGGVSRYDADYMSRAFGEWIQQQGVITVLVEAGGLCDGRAARAETVRLAELHLCGMAAALGEIADDAYLQADPQRYDALERSGEHPLFDCMVRGATLVNGCGHAPFRADLGVNFAAGRRVTCRRDAEGVIEEIGDLDVTSGKQVVSADQLVSLPGQWIWRPEMTPDRLPDLAAWQEALARGGTTLVGKIDLTQESDVIAWERLAASDWHGPGNVTFVAEWRAGIAANDDPGTDEIVVLARLWRCLASGTTAVWGECSTAVRQALGCWGVPVLNGAAPLAACDGNASLAQTALASVRAAQTLQLDDRVGPLRRGLAADLQLWDAGGGADRLAPSSATARLRYVMVGGSVVWTEKGLEAARPGRILLSRVGRAAAQQRSQLSAHPPGASCSTRSGSD